MHQVMYYWSLHNPSVSFVIVGHVTLYKLKKECYLLMDCLVDATRMLLFVAIILPDGRDLVDA